MKKIFFPCLAIAAIASCAKTEPTYTNVDSEIRLAPVTAMATKANVTGAINSTAYPTNENFKVYAYWADKPAGSDFNADETGSSAYLNNVEFTNKGLYWGGTTTYYWPKNGSLRFAAYSPATVNMTHRLASDVYELNGFAYPTNVNDTYEVLVAPTSTSYTAQTAAEKVSVVFEHALAWLQFNVKAANADAVGKFIVKNITINNVNNYGNMVADMMAGTKTWTSAYQTTTAPQFLVYNNETGTTVTDVQTLLENAAAGRTAGEGVIVLPQATTTVTITFDQLSGVQGVPTISNQTVTIPLTLEDAKPWEAGKKYIYTVLFDVDEILINPSVEDWEEVVVPEIDATAAEVSSSEELVNAVAAGRSVRLTSDIELDAPVIVDPTTFATKAQPSATLDVTIDLNGNDIVAPLFAESNGAITAGNTDSYAFWVKKGAKLTINGNGNVTTQACKFSIAVWAQGGEVVINGGTYANAGEGSDLIYASAGGKVTINGGEFNACEKQPGTDGTQEKYSVLNLKGDNSGCSILVRGGRYYGFNPADNKSEKPAVNFVDAGYNVVCDAEGWYNVTAAAADVVLASDAVVAATYNVKNAVLDGAGNTIKAKATAAMFSGSTLPFVSLAGNAVVKNVVLDGDSQSYAAANGKTYGIRNIYIAAEGNYTIENVKAIKNTYALNVNTTKSVVLNITNSTLQGWVSYGTSTVATLNNVKFESGEEQTYRPYGRTALYNCAFAKGYIIDLSCLSDTESIVFESCTYAGRALTAADLKGVKEGANVTIR